MRLRLDAYQRATFVPSVINPPFSVRNAFPLPCGKAIMSPGTAGMMALDVQRLCEAESRRRVPVEFWNRYDDSKSLARKSGV